MAIKTNAAKIISSDKKDIPSNYLPAGDSDNGVGYLISFAKKPLIQERSLNMKKDDIMPEDKDNLRVITKVTKMNYLI